VSPKLTRSVPARINAAALLLAILGMIVQIASGVKYPTVPPGIVLLAAAALLVTFVPWRPLRLLGVLVPLFILVGGIISTTGRTNLSHTDPFGPFIGTVIQFAGLALGVVAGLAAVLEWRADRIRVGSGARRATKTAV
jgi:hypothetical protein